MLSKKGLVVPLLIVVVAVLAIGGVAYFASHEKAEAPGMVIEGDVSVQSTSTSITATSTSNSGEGIYITSISPSFGPAGSTVTLRGNGFTSGKQVFVSISDSDLKAWEVVSVSTTTLVFVIPNDLSVGTHDVSVLVSAKYTPVSNSVKFTVTNNNTASPAPVACTMDAMMCPDGSYVGRSGPNCEFVCPNISKEGWFTYNNAEYGFQFEYPKNWYINAEKKVEPSKYDEGMFFFVNMLDSSNNNSNSSVMTDRFVVSKLKVKCQDSDWKERFGNSLGNSVTDKYLTKTFCANESLSMTMYVNRDGSEDSPKNILEAISKTLK